MSSTTQPRKGSMTDSDANDDRHLQEELHIIDDVTSKEVEYENEDVSCSNVVCQNDFTQICYQYL